MPTLSRFPPLHHEHAANNTCYRTAVLAATSLAGLRVPEEGTRPSFSPPGCWTLGHQEKKEASVPGGSPWVSRSLQVPWA